MSVETAVAKIMKALEEEMMKPRPNQKQLTILNQQLDKALGTELKEEDLDRAGAWERSRRG